MDLDSRFVKPYVKLLHVMRPRLFERVSTEIPKERIPATLGTMFSGWR